MSARVVYPVSTMRRAQELRAAEWSPRDVQRLLAAEGLGRPSETTIKRWSNPVYDASQRARIREINEAKRAGTGRFTLRGASKPYRDAFVALLRERGVTDLNIRRVCEVVFADTPVTDARMREQRQATKLGRVAPHRRDELIQLGLQMREDGQSYTAIAWVFAHYEGVTMTPDSLRAWLTMHGAKRDPKKSAAVRALHAA